MSTRNPNNLILELRVALTTSDYERSVKFYCDGLGLEPTGIWNNDGAGR
jgi:catechol 2,3-dioxygenase-like lactoylglutathione lyase family enzyme